MKNALAFMSFALLLVLSIFACGMLNAPKWLTDIVILAAGVYAYIESFAKYKIFRRVRDTATSKIGSLPVGFVEIYGKAKRFPGMHEIYYYLSNRNNFDWFSNLIFSPKDSLVAKPFYIEDETGKVYVDPFCAEMVLDYKTRFDGEFVYREAEIKEGDYVYCLGSVQRKDVSDISAEINKALKDAKANKEKMKRFDKNRDGKISEEEWFEARKFIENEVLNKNLNKNDIYLPVIGKSAYDPVFVISQKSEKEIVKRFFIKYVLTLAAGIALTAFMLARVFLALPL
ncbi:MAG: hypothetical protein LBR69_01850 [Endomicrobium sp.]|jgi:hypothetical protein|nr:hypothetical protein [Endomicrobium sp.]